MSETRKAQPEAIADAATRGARETLGRAENASKRSAEEAGRIGVSVADTVARTTDAALKITERAAEQGRDVMWQGWCAAADMNSRLADVGYGRRHRVLEQCARTLELYREAGEATAEHMQALFTCGLSLTRGMQELQLTALRMLDNAAERGGHKPRDLLRCRSMADVAEMQRDFYRDSVTEAMKATSTLLQIAGRVAQEAMRPLQGAAARASTGLITPG